MLFSACAFDIRFNFNYFSIGNADVSYLFSHWGRLAGSVNDPSVSDNAVHYIFPVSVT